MRKRALYIIISILVSINISYAQHVQWATEVLSYSSQHDVDDYAAHQVLAYPNAFANPETAYMAWLPAQGQNTGEAYIKVRFAIPTLASQIAIAESGNTGGIAKVYLYDKNQKEYKIYENANPSPTGARLFRHDFPQTNYYVTALKVVLSAEAVKRGNQIDAIAISDSNIPINTTINAIDYIENTSAEYLGLAVNSSFSEHTPIITPDGRSLFFARSKHPQNMGAENHEDIWMSTLQIDGSWSRAVNMGMPLNDTDANIVAASSASGDKLYLIKQYNDAQKTGISVSKKRGRAWTRPNILNIKNHYNNSPFVAYHLNIDENILLMSVARSDTYGDRDFYVSFKKKNKEWSEPLNMGSTINTCATEKSIFLAADGRTIYFASNGHPTYGGFDMYRSYRLDDTWTNWSSPENLGKPINTTGDDFNYSIPASGDYAYFAAGDVTNTDLYRIKLPKTVQPEAVILLSTRIINSETGAPVIGKLQYETLGEKKGLAPSIGKYHQLILPFGKNIGLYTEKPGYFSTSENVALAAKTLEGIDYDPNKTAASQSTYDPNNEVIDELQLRLNNVKKDLRNIEEERNQQQELNISQGQNQTKYNELESLKNTFNTVNQKEEKEAFVSTGNPELDALKRKFNAYYAEKEKTEKEAKPSSSDKDKKELDELKRKFNMHNNPDNVATKAEETPSDIPIDFDTYQEEIRQELITYLLPIVKKELQEQLYEEVKRDLERDLELELRNNLRYTSMADIKDQLDVNIVNYSLFSDANEAYIRAEIRKELKREIEKDLRATLKAKIEKELRAELKESVRAELRRELEYVVKQDLEAEIAAEIKKKQDVQRYLEQAQELTNNSTIIAENTSKLIEPSYQEIQKEILLIPIKAGQIIPMNNIFFDTNQTTLKVESYAELDRIVKFLKQNSSLKIEIGGHTNAWCSHQFANELSTERAQAVRNHIIERGIAANRIKAYGYGKTQAIASNNTNAGRQKNQRVEMKILQ